MNINGKNGLACLTNMKQTCRRRSRCAVARPAGHPRPDRGYDPVLQDQYQKVKPYLVGS